MFDTTKSAIVQLQPTDEILARNKASFRTDAAQLSPLPIFSHPVLSSERRFGERAFPNKRTITIQAIFSPSRQPITLQEVPLMGPTFSFVSPNAPLLQDLWKDPLRAFSYGYAQGALFQLDQNRSIERIIRQPEQYLGLNRLEDIYKNQETAKKALEQIRQIFAGELTRADYANDAARYLYLQYQQVGPTNSSLGIFLKGAIETPAETALVTPAFPFSGLSETLSSSTLNLLRRLQTPNLKPDQLRTIRQRVLYRIENTRELIRFIQNEFLPELIKELPSNVRQQLKGDVQLVHIRVLEDALQELVKQKQNQLGKNNPSYQAWIEKANAAWALLGLHAIHHEDISNNLVALNVIRDSVRVATSALERARRFLFEGQPTENRIAIGGLLYISALSLIQNGGMSNDAALVRNAAISYLNAYEPSLFKDGGRHLKPFSQLLREAQQGQLELRALRQTSTLLERFRDFATQQTNTSKKPQRYGGRILNYPILDGNAETGWKIPSLSDYLMRSMELMDTIGEQRVERLVNAIQALDLKALERYKKEVVPPQRPTDGFGFQDSPREKLTKDDAARLFETVVLRNLNELKKLVETGGIVRHWGSVRAIYHQTQTMVNKLFPRNSSIHATLKPIFDAIESVNDGLERTAALKGIGSPRLNGLQYIGLVYGDSLARLAKNAIGVGLLPRASLMVELGRRTVGELTWNDLKMTNWQDATQRELIRNYLTQNFMIGLSEMGDMSDILLQLPTNEIGRAIYRLIGGRTVTYHPYFIENILPGASREYIEFGSRLASLSGVTPETGQFMAAMFLSSGLMNPGAIVAWLLPSTIARVGSFAGSALLKIGSAIGRGSRALHSLGKIGHQIAHISQRLTPDLIGGLAVAGRSLGWSVNNLYQTMQFLGNIGDVADAVLMGGDWSTVLTALAFSPETLLTLKSEIETQGPVWGTLRFLLPDVANAAQFGKRVYETAQLLRSIETEIPKLSWDSFTEGTLHNFASSGRALAFDLQDRKLVQTEGFSTPDKSRVLIKKGETSYERPTEALLLVDPLLVEKAKQSQPRMALSILMGLWMRDQQKNPYAITTESLTALFGPEALQTLDALKAVNAVQTQVESDGTETVRLTDAAKQLLGWVFDESIPARLWLQYLRDRYGAQIHERDALSLVQMLDQLPSPIKARLSLGVKLSVLERLLETLETAQSGIQAIESVSLATRTDNATRIRTIVAKDGSYAYIFTDDPLDPIEQPLLKFRLNTDAKAIPGILETIASAIEELVGQNAFVEVVGYKALPDGGSELIVQIDTEDGFLKEPSLTQLVQSLNRALNGLKTQLRREELNAESAVKSVFDALALLAPGGVELGMFIPTTRTIHLTPPSLPKYERLMSTPRLTRNLRRKEQRRKHAERRRRNKAQQAANLDNEYATKLQQTEKEIVLDLSRTLLRFAQNATLRKAAFTEPTEPKVAVWRFETEHEPMLRTIQALNIALRSETPVQALRQIYRQARTQTIATIIQHYAGALQDSDYETLAATIQETPEIGWKRLFEAIDQGVWHEPMETALRSETAFEYLKQTAKPSLKAVLEPYQTLEAFLQDLSRLLLEGETGYARISAIRHLLGVVQTLALLSTLPKSQITALETHEILEATVEAALSLPIHVLERFNRPAWQALATEKRELFRQIASRLMPIESIRLVGIPETQIETYQNQLIALWPKIEAAIWHGHEEQLAEILKALEWFQLVSPAQGNWTNEQTPFQALAALWINEFKTHTHEAQTLARIHDWLNNQPKNALGQSPGKIVLEGLLKLGSRAYYTLPIQITTETGESFVRPAIVRLVASQNQPAFLVEEALHYLHYRWSQELGQLAALNQPLGLSPAFVKFSQLVHYLTEDRAQEEIRDAYIRYGLEMIDKLAKMPNILSALPNSNKAMTYFEQVFHEGGIASHLMDQALQRYPRGLTIGALAPAFDAAYIRHGLSWRISIQDKAIEKAAELINQENTNQLHALASQLPLGLFHEDAPLTEAIYNQPRETQTTPLDNLRGLQNYLYDHWKEGETLSTWNLKHYIKTSDVSLLDDVSFLFSLEAHLHSVGLIKAFNEGRYLTTHLESVMDYTPPQQPSQQKRYRIRKPIGQSLIEIEALPSLTPEGIRFLYQRERIRKQFLYRLFARTVESHFSLAEKIQETINDNWVNQLNKTVNDFLDAQNTNDLQAILSDNLLREKLSKAIEPLLQEVLGIGYTQEPSERRTIDTYIELPVQVNDRLFGITVHVRSHPESGVRDLFSPTQFTIVDDAPRDLSISVARYEQLLWMGASNNQRALASSLLVGKRLRSKDGKQYIVRSVQMLPNGQMIALVLPDKPIRPLQETRPFIESEILFDLSVPKPKKEDATTSVWPISPSTYIFDERLLIETALKKAQASNHVAFQTLTNEKLAHTLKHSVILKWLLTTVLKTIDQLPDCGLYFKGDEEGYRVLLPNIGYARQRPSLEAFEGIKKSVFLNRIERLKEALSLLEQAPPVDFLIGEYDTETVLEQSTLETRDLAKSERVRRLQILIQSLKNALKEIETTLQNAPDDARIYSFALSATASVLPIESFLDRWQSVAKGQISDPMIASELKFNRELRQGAFEPIYRLGRMTSAELTFIMYELLSDDDPFILQLATQTNLVDPFISPYETLASLGLTYEERDLGILYPRITKPETLATQLQSALLEITNDPVMAKRMTDQATLFAITAAQTQPYQSGGIASPITLGALPSLKLALIRIDGRPLIGKLFVSGGLYEQLEATGKNVYVFPLGYELLKKRVEGRGVPIQLDLFTDAIHSSELVVETEVRTPIGMMTIDPREVALQIATLYNLGRVETIQEVVKSMYERYPFMRRLYGRIQQAQRLSLTETSLAFLQALRAKQFIFPIDLSLSAYARVIVIHPTSVASNTQRYELLIKAQQNDFLNRLKDSQRFSSDVIAAFENFFRQPETDNESFVNLFHLLIGLDETLQEEILEALFDSMGTLSGLPKFLIPIFTDTLIESHAELFNFAIGLKEKLSQKWPPHKVRQTIQTILEWSFNPFSRQTMNPDVHQTIGNAFKNLLVTPEKIEEEWLALEEEWLAEELAKITPEEIEAIRQTFEIEPFEEGLFHDETLLKSSPEMASDPYAHQSTEANRQLRESLYDPSDDESPGLFHTSTPFHTEQGRFLDSLTVVPTPPLYQTAFYAIGRSDSEKTSFTMDRIVIAPKLKFHSITPSRISETPSEDQPIETLLIEETNTNQFWSIREYDPNSPTDQPTKEGSVQRTFVQNVREIGHGGLLYSITNLNGLLTSTDALKRLMYPIMGYDELKDKILYDLIGTESFYQTSLQQYLTQEKTDKEKPIPIEDAGLRIHGRPNQIYSWAVLGVYQPMALRSYRVDNPSDTLDYAHYERGSRQIRRPMLHLHVLSSLDWLGTIGEFRNVLEQLIIELSNRNELDYLSAPKVLVGDLQAAKQSNRELALQQGGLLANLTVLFEEIEEAFRKFDPRERNQLFLRKLAKTLFENEKEEPWQERLAFLLENVRHGFTIETKHGQRSITLTMGDILRLRLIAEAHVQADEGIQFIEEALNAIAGNTDPSHFDANYRTYREALTMNLDEVNFRLRNMLGDFVNDLITTITMLTVSPVLLAAAPSVAAVATDALPIQALDKRTTTNIRRASPSTPELSYALGAPIESPHRFLKQQTLYNYYNDENEDGLIVRVVGGVVTTLEETSDLARIDTKRPYKQRVTHTNTNHAFTLDITEVDPENPSQREVQTQLILPTPIMPPEARLALTETIARLANLQPAETSKTEKPSITIGLGPYGRRLLGLRFGLVFEGDYETLGEVAERRAFTPSISQSFPNARVYSPETFGYDPYVLAFSENAFSRDKLTPLPELIATEGLANWAERYKHTLLTWLYDLSRTYAWLSERLGKPKQTAFEALQSLVGDTTMFYTEGQPFARRVGAWMFSTASSSMALGYALAQISRYVINSDPAFATILTQSLGTLLGTLAIIGLFAKHGAFSTFASAIQAISLRKRALNRWIERFESLIRQSQSDPLDLSAQRQATEIMAAIQESRITLAEDQAFLARMHTAPGEIVPDILFAPTTTLASEYGFPSPLQEAEPQPPTIDTLRNETIRLRKELRLLAALPIRARFDRTEQIATLRKRAYETATRLLKALIEEALPTDRHRGQKLQANEHARAFVFLALLTEAMSGKIFSVTGNHLDIDLANLLDYVVELSQPHHQQARQQKIHKLLTAFSRTNEEDHQLLVTNGINQLFDFRQLPFFYLLGQATPYLTPFERLLGLLRVKTLNEAIYQNVTYHDRQAIQALEMTYHLSREGPTVISLDPLGGHYERPTENIAKTLGGFAGIFLPSHLKTTVAETAYTIRDLWNILSGGAAFLINAGLNAMFRNNPLNVGQPNTRHLRTLMRSLSETMVSPKIALITLVGGSLAAPEIVRMFGVDAGALLQSVYNTLQYWPLQLAVYYLLGKGLMQSARMLLPNMGLFFSAMRNKLGTIEVRRTIVEIARSAFEALRTHVIDKEELIDALKLYANQEPYSYDAIRSALRNSIVRKEDAGALERRLLEKPTDPKLYPGLILQGSREPAVQASSKSGTSDPILAAIRAHEKSPIETFITSITPPVTLPFITPTEEQVNLNAPDYTIATLELNNEEEARIIQQALRELFSAYRDYANRNGTSVAFWNQLSGDLSVQYRTAGQTSTGKTLYRFFVSLMQETQPYLFDLFMMIEHMRSLRFITFDRFAEFVRQATPNRWLAEKAIEAAHQSLERLAKFYLAFIDPTYETLYVPENRFGLEISSGGLHLPFGGETVIQQVLQSDLQRLGDAESVIESTIDVAKGKGEAVVAQNRVEKMLKRLFEIRKRRIQEGNLSAAQAAFNRLMTRMGNQHYQREAELRDLAELKGGRQILSGTGVTQASPLEYGQDYLTTASKLAIVKSFLEKQTPLYVLDADLNVIFDPFEYDQAIKNADWFLSKFVIQFLDTVFSPQTNTEPSRFGPPIVQYLNNHRQNLVSLAQAYDSSFMNNNPQVIRTNRAALIQELLRMENALLESLIHNLRQLSLVDAQRAVSFEEALSIAMHEIRKGGEGEQFLERLLRVFSVIQLLRVSLEMLHEADQANLNNPDEALNALFALTVFNYSAQSLLIGLAYLTDAYIRALADAPVIRNTREQLRRLQQQITLFDADFLTLLDQLPSAAIGAILYNVFQQTKPTQQTQQTQQPLPATVDAFDGITLLENAVSTIRNVSWLSTYLRDRINQKPTLATVQLRQENRRIYEAVRTKLLMGKALVEFITAQAASRLKFRSQLVNRASGMLLQAPGFVKQILVSHFIQPYNFLQMVKTMLGAYQEHDPRIRATFFLPHRRIFAVAGLVTLLMAGSGWLTYQQLKHGYNAPLVFGDESGIMVQIHMNPNNPARFNTATVRVPDHRYQYTFDNGRFTGLIGQWIGNLNVEATPRSITDYPALFGEAIGNTLLGTLSEITKGQTFAGYALTTGFNQLGFTSIRVPVSGAPLLLLTEQEYINPSLPLLLAQRFYNSLPPIFFTAVTPREKSWFESILKNPQTDLKAVNAILAAFGLNDPLQVSAYDETTGGISPNTIFVQRGYMGGLQGDYHNQEIYEQVSKELYGFAGHRVQPAYQIKQDRNGRWQFVPQDRSIQREVARITGGLGSWAAREMRSGGVRHEELATETPFNILSIGQQLNVRYKPIRFHLSAHVLAQNVQRDLEIYQKQVGGNQALVVEYFNPLMQTSLEPIVRNLGITSWDELKTALYGSTGYLAVTTLLDHTPDQNKTIRTIAGYGVRELHYHSPITQTRVLIEALKPQVENPHLLPGGVIHTKGPVVSRHGADYQQTEYDMVHRLINLNGYFMNLQTGPVIFVERDNGRLVFENIDEALRTIESFGGLWIPVEGRSGRYFVTPAFFKVKTDDEQLRGILVAKLASDGSINQVGAFVIRSEGTPRVQSIGYYENGSYLTLSSNDLRSMYSGAIDYLKQRAIEATLNPALWDGLRDLPSDLVSAWQTRLSLPDAAVYQKLLIWYALIENRTDQWTLYSALENFTKEYYLPYGTQLIAETLHRNRVVAHALVTVPQSDFDQLRKIAQTEHARLQRELNELRETLIRTYQSKANRSKVEQLAFEHALQKLDVFERTLLRFLPGSRRFNTLVSNMARIVSADTIDAQAFAFGFQTALISDYLEQLDKDAQGRFVGYRVYVPTRNPNRYAPIRIEKPSDPFSATAAVALDYTLRQHRQLREKRVDTSRYAFVLEPTPDNWLSRLIATPFKR